MLPVALLCLFDEHLRMHKARQLVASVPQIVPLGMHVDGLFYTGPKEADQALQRLAKAEKYVLNSASVSGFGFWLALAFFDFFGQDFKKQKASLKSALYKVGLYSSGELRRSKPVWGPCEPSCVHRGSFEGWFVGLRVGLKV